MRVPRSIQRLVFFVGFPLIALGLTLLGQDWLAAGMMMVVALLCLEDLRIRSR